MMDFIMIAILAGCIGLYVYFYLAEKFGGVPLIKELQEYDPANPGALVVPRLSLIHI